MLSGVVHARSTRAWSEAGVMIDQWTIDDGLPLDHMIEIAISPAGFVWLATMDGLVRFDGERFRTYRKGEFPELPSNRLIGLCFGDDEHPWVTTESNELLHFDGERFHLWEEFRGEWHLTKRREGPVLWGLDHRRALRVDREGPQHVAGFPRGRVVLADIRGETWVGAARGVFRLVDGPEARPIPGLEALQDVRGLAEDPAGGVWIGARDGLWHFGPEGLEAAAPDRPREPVRALARADRLWVGDAAGWWITDGQAVEALAEPPLENSPAAARAAGGVVWRAAEGWLARGRARMPMDVRVWAPREDGSAWVVTNGAGLLWVRPAEVQSVAPEVGSIANVVAAADDGIWAMVLNRREVVELARDGEALPEPRPELPLPEGFSAVRHLVGPDGAFFVRTEWPLGIWRSEGEALEQRGDFPGFELLTTTSDGRLWLQGDELYAGRPEGGTWRWETVPLPIERTRIAAAHEAPDGALWIGTLGSGVVRVAAAGARQWSVADGLTSVNVRAVWVDPDGVAWIGTQDAGLCRLDPASSAVRCLGTRDGLFDDAIHSVLPDEQGRLWMSTNRGIFWVLRSQLEEFAAGERPAVLSVGFNEREGMANREANGGNPQSAARDRAGRLWYPTQAGLAVIDPAAVPIPTPPRVHLEDLSVDDTPTRLGDEVLRLPSDHHELAVGWTSPEFARPEQLRFRYRMRGLDADWRSPTRERRATWTWLPPGDLQLEVQAALGGAWGPVATLALYRAPAFVETPAFLASLALSGLGLGGLWTLWRGAQSRRRQAALEALVAARTAALADTNRTLAAQTDTLASQASALEVQAGQLREAADTLARRNAELTVASARLAEVDALRTRLIADLSHELRTPLTLIAGPLEDLAGSDEVPLGPARDRLEVVLRNAHRLESLVDQLLDLTRLESGKIALRVRLRDLGAEVREVASRFASECERARLALEVELPPGPVALFFDGDLIDKVLGNLLSNALKFTPAGGRIRVRLAAPADDEEPVRVEVRDTGIGVPEGLRDRLFDRFVQGERGDARRFEGVGIGLALARDLVTLHGGEIGVESEAGQGSVFWFTLPRGVDHLGPEDVALGDDPPPASDLARHDETTLPRPPEEGGEARPRVLVVEDHPDMRDFLAAHLGRSFQVATAPGGAEALTLARADPPAAIVSDVMMPGMDGLELCRRLRDDPGLRGVPILLASAKSTEADRVAGLELADDYMTKPLRMRELLARVHKLIARRAARSEGPTPSEEPVDAARDTPHDPAAAPDSALGDPPRLGVADQELRARIEALLAARLSNPEFGVEQMARALAFSRRQLLRETQRVLGESPSDLLRARRIEAGHRLLVTGSVRTVGEAAARVGLSVSYFSRTYTAWYKHAPSETLTRSASP